MVVSRDSEPVRFLAGVFEKGGMRKAKRDCGDQGRRAEDAHARRRNVRSSYRERRVLASRRCELLALFGRKLRALVAAPSAREGVSRLPPA